MSKDNKAFAEVTAMTGYRALRLAKKPFLVVMTGKDLAHRYQLEKAEIIIGRALDADIVLEDGRSSRQHARICSKDNETVLEDMNSTNGTYVNNQKITTWSLLDGDLISIGNTLLKFSYQSEVEGEYHDGMIDSVKTDGLTELLSRRFFDQQFDAEIAQAQRAGSALSFILCDLDDFKSINDVYGHQIGDLVLKLVSSAIQKTIRSTDCAGRYGGEELCVLLPETALEGACQAAEKIRQAVEQLDINQEQGDLHVTISIGVSALSKDTNTTAAMLQKADENLYKAKAGGKNQVVG